MIVVADTSPLNYLVWIGEAELLLGLFGKVLIPEAVYRELQHPRTALVVREWIKHPPEWLERRTVAGTPDLRLAGLDLGEREAIQLALEAGARSS